SDQPHAVPRLVDLLELCAAGVTGRHRSHLHLHSPEIRALTVFACKLGTRQASHDAVRIDYIPPHAIQRRVDAEGLLDSKCHHPSIARARHAFRTLILSPQSPARIFLHPAWRVASRECVVREEIRTI